MPVPRIGTLLGGLLLSRAGRRFAGKHAGKLALATLALQLWETRRAGKAAAAKRPESRRARAHPRQRWSGRRR